VRRTVLNDVDAAHLGAFAGQSGILILSGTGSMAWARDAAGNSHRVGGWGDAIGDEGSSHWIGRKILGLVSQSLDGRAAPTALSEALFDSLGLDPADPMNSLGGWVSRLTDPRAEVAALAPLASRLAESGDAGAQGIIEAAAEELARHVTAIARLAGQDLDWSHAGGTFASAPLREAVARRLGRPPKPPRLPPIGGALLAAAQHVGWAADAQWIDRLAASLAAPAPSVNELQPTN
jgi:N-acetylglucosamine kinase-like BadF-type ATPase